MRVSSVMAMPAIMASPRPRSSASSSCLPGHRLDLALVGNAELGADGAHQIDVETRQPAVTVEIVEGREVGGGQEAQARQRTEIGFGQPFLDVPEHRRGRLLGRRRGAGEKGCCRDPARIVDRSFIRIPTAPVARAFTPGRPYRKALFLRNAPFHNEIRSPDRCESAGQRNFPLAHMISTAAQPNMLSCNPRLMVRGGPGSYDTAIVRQHGWMLRWVISIER